MATATDYKNLLIRLLPTGKAWRVDDGSITSKLMAAFGLELSRVDQDMEILLREQDPSKAVTTLSDWESEYGLPDECSVLAGSLAQRRYNLLKKITTEGGQSEQFFIDLFAAEGVTITIDHGEVTTAPLVPPMAIRGPSWKRVWYVNIGGGGFVTYASAGDPAGSFVETISGASNVACIIEKYKPAHTHVIYSYGS